LDYCADRPPIARGHRRECRVLEIAAAEPVQCGGEPRDRCGDDDALAATHAAGLGERLQPVDPLAQVIEGPQEKHGIDARLCQL